MLMPSTRSLLVLLALAPAAAASQPPPRYTVERLGDLGDVSIVGTLSMNDSGWVAGTQGRMMHARPFLRVGGEFRYLEGFAGEASRVSEAGAVVGTGRESLSGSFAYLWQEGRTTRLPVPQGFFTSTGFGINGRGDAVGSGARPGAPSVALLWSGGTVRSLAPLVPGGLAAAVAINNAGVVLGTAQGSDGELHAVLWRNGRVVDLGPSTGGTYMPSDLNERGQVVGSMDGDLLVRAFLWENGRMKDLTPPGMMASAAAINDSGQVVGEVSPLEGTGRPVLWDGGRVLYLDELLPADAGLRLTHALDINNHGWILGLATLADDKVEAVLLRPER